jgi:hypothetical protein
MRSRNATWWSSSSLGERRDRQAHAEVVRLSIRCSRSTSSGIATGLTR